MDPRFIQIPKSLQAKSSTMRLGDDVPALIAHPQWDQESRERIPSVIWMHGRTVQKELDSGRYSRWIRAGIGAVALDLPGHGERFDESFQSPDRTLELIEQASNEIDGVLESMDKLDCFDMDQVAIGGMSAGGMVTLNRLCSNHSFVGAVLEGTTGNLHDMYFPEPGSQVRAWITKHDQEDVRRVDPMAKLDQFRPIPMLGVHNEGDRVVPISTQRKFFETLREHYANLNSDPHMIEFKSYTDSGAPDEHSGFGKFSSESKMIQLESLQRMFEMSRA